MAQQHLQAKGKTILFGDTDSFIEKRLIPEDLPIGRVIDPRKFIEKQKYIKSLYSDDKISRIEIRDFEELRYATCLEFGDSEGFVAVSETGEMISVLKSPASKMQNFLGIAFANAVMVGGSRLDCYACDNLEPTYCRRGFIPICKIEFDEQYAADMAKYYPSHPDIVFFIYCGDPVYTYWQKMNDGLYMAWENYEYIPYISEIRKMIDPKDTNKESDYDFAGRFRDLIWGKWNGGLKREFMFRPNKLMNYVCSNAQRLEDWMQ